MNNVDLRLGDWRTVLDDVGSVDAIITDPPYSERTATGFRGNRGGGEFAEGINYGFISKEDIDMCVYHWFMLVRDWFVVFGDHITAQLWADALDRVGDFYVFAPIPWIKRDSPPRFQGDGPACQAEWITVARPKKAVRRTGSRPGYYIGNIDTAGKNAGTIVTGGKPGYLMRALVRDYSEPGDLVCDPFAGGGSTLIAAAEEGRRAVGAEVDPATHAKATARIASGIQAPLFVG